MRDRLAYGPGFAVGAWFIPLANFVLPGLIVADQWRAATRTGAGIVAGWWVGYMVMTIVEAVSGVPGLAHGGNFGLPMALGWIGLLLTLVTYGLWILIVRPATDAVAGAR